MGHKVRPRIQTTIPIWLVTNDRGLYLQRGTVEFGELRWARCYMSRPAAARDADTLNAKVVPATRSFITEVEEGSG